MCKLLTFFYAERAYVPSYLFGVKQKRKTREIQCKLLQEKGSRGWGQVAQLEPEMLTKQEDLHTRPSTSKHRNKGFC